MLRLLTVAAALAPTALAGVVDKLPAVPAGWSVHEEMSLAKVSSQQMSTFTISLAMAKQDDIGSMLLDVSTPGEKSYGKFLDDEPFNKAFAPHPNVVKKVTKWLKQSGVKHFNVDGAFVDFAADIPTVNRMLGADYKYYQNGDSRKLRTLQYSVPDHIEELINLVDPATFFGRPKAPAPREAGPADVPFTPRGVKVDAACQTEITPDCLKQLYSVGDYKADADSGSRVGFGSFLNQTAIYQDLFTFEDEFGIPKQSFDVQLINGGENSQVIDGSRIGEANLDAQSIIGIDHPLPMTEFITGGSPPFVPTLDQPTAADNQNEPYLPYYRYLLRQPRSKLPQVISNSYGDVEEGVPRNYAKLTCDLIGLMGLRGVTVIESSGDTGVGAGCLAPDMKTVQFDPIFPATCPFITSVGGTVAVTPEIAWKGSSGGFSKYFGRPLYQERAIREYLKTVSRETYEYYGQYTNFKGRGFPDIAAHSVAPNYVIYYGGRRSQSGGTSAAAPVFAGIVGLLNDARLRTGKPTLGWLNPLIYAFPNIFNDITGGYAIGCDGGNTQTGAQEPEGAGIVPGARWNATKGWDPVTGYGTPNFEKMKKLVLSF